MRHPRMTLGCFQVLSRLRASLISSAADYSRPRNVGTLDKSDSSVGEGLVGAPAVCPAPQVPDIRLNEG